MIDPDVRERISAASKAEKERAQAAQDDLITRLQQRAGQAFMDGDDSLATLLRDAYLEINTARVGIGRR